MPFPFRPLPTHRVPLVHWLPANTYLFTPDASSVISSGDTALIAAVSFNSASGGPTAAIRDINCISIFLNGTVYAIPGSGTAITQGNVSLYQRNNIAPNTLSWAPGVLPTMNLQYTLTDPDTGNIIYQGSLYSNPTAEPVGDFNLAEPLDLQASIWFAYGQWSLTKIVGWITGWFDAPYF